MELQDFGPIVQARTGLQNNAASTNCVTPFLLGIGLGIIIGSMLITYRQQAELAINSYASKS